MKHLFPTWLCLDSGTQFKIGITFKTKLNHIELSLE